MSTSTATPRSAPPAPRTGTAPRRRGWQVSTRIQAAVLAAVFLIAAVAAWQLAVTLEVTSSLILPAPLDVADSLRAGLTPGTGSWWGDIGVTLQTTTIGFFIGIAVAFVLGTLLAYVEVLRMAIYPYVIFFQTFPKVAIAPLLVSWLGYGLTPKAVIGALLAFFPMFTNTLAGMSEIDKDELRLMRSLGASRMQEMRLLRLPNTMPYIFAAMDVALVMSLLGVIVGEFVGADAGLGFRIQDRTAFGDTASVYAVLLILGVLGTTLHLLMVGVKKAVLFRE